MIPFQRTISSELRSALIAFLAVSFSLIGVGCSSTTETSIQPAPGEAQTPPSAPAQSPPLREPDVIYVPTPPQVVEQMLAIANVNQDNPK